VPAQTAPSTPRGLSPETPEASWSELPILAENDIVAARQMARTLATELLFGATDVTRIVTTVSELARNVIVYAGTGVMRWKAIQRLDRSGLELIFEDRGPGIADIQLAMCRGYSTNGSLGLGLPGAERLMDEFEITSAVGVGTTVRVCKWCPSK
jgi:serine/threonine-protein kinase RsbT